MEKRSQFLAEYCEDLLVEKSKVETLTRSVLSRVQEIDVLKATGVKDEVVFGLFVVEAILYGFAGGILGAFLGWIVSAIVLVTAWIPIWRIVKLSAIQALYYRF